MHIVTQEKGGKTNVFFGLLVFHLTYICRLMASYIPGTVLEAGDANRNMSGLLRSLKDEHPGHQFRACL